MEVTAVAGSRGCDMEVAAVAGIREPRGWCTGLLVV